MINFEWDDSLKDPPAPPEISIKIKIIKRESYTVTAYGYLNQDGEFIEHLEDAPAYFCFVGYERWYFNGKIHRVNGPAVIRDYGREEWYQNDLRHRVGGPAIVDPDGTEIWCQNGLYHRLDGPALMRSDGTKEWWINGVHREDLE